MRKELRYYCLPDVSHCTEIIEGSQKKSIGNIMALFKINVLFRDKAKERNMNEKIVVRFEIRSDFFLFAEKRLLFSLEQGGYGGVV